MTFPDWRMPKPDMKRTGRNRWCPSTPQATRCPSYPHPRKACYLRRRIDHQQRGIREVRREEDPENVNLFILLGIG